MVLVIFWHFLNFGPFFGLFLGILVENAKKRVAHGNSLNYQQTKNPNIDIGVPTMCLFKMYIFGAPIGSEGPGMVSS